MQVAKAGDWKSPLLDLGAHVVISTSLVQIQPYPLHMGRWAELVTQRAVNPWPSGIVGSSPTRPTIEGQPLIRCSYIVDLMSAI